VSRPRRPSQLAVARSLTWALVGYGAFDFLLLATGGRWFR